jgi:hypothetical protein
MRYLLSLLLTLAACFTAQVLALYTSGGRTLKSESNFFSSLGRIQAGAQGMPEVMVLGSSITGRLPDRAQGFEGWANMGCDGGSAIDALRAMDEEILPAAPNLIIEANTLQLGLGSKATEIGQAMQRPWFKVGLRVSVLSAYARPSAFFYSKLLERRIAGANDDSKHKDLGVQSRPKKIDGYMSVKINSEESALIKEITHILKRLEAKGSQSTLVWLPPARMSESEPPAWIVELARQANAKYWDLGQEAPLGNITLTDGVHMNQASASRTMQSLIDAFPG